MKKLLFLLSFVIFLSCEKEKYLQCEIDQTFTLIFRNYQLSGGYGYIKYLHVNDDLVDVEYIFSDLKYAVKVSEISQVYVIERNGDIKGILQTPNPCANYNYFW
jgi:hypothetical protein